VTDDLDPYRTESQKQWNDWARHGYRKLYQPRSMLWFGGIFFTLLAVGPAADGRRRSPSGTWPSRWLSSP
jgi:hypothetical protein